MKEKQEQEWVDGLERVQKWDHDQRVDIDEKVAKKKQVEYVLFLMLWVQFCRITQMEE